MITSSPAPTPQATSASVIPTVPLVTATANWVPQAAATAWVDKNILEFERDYPDAKVVRLEQNYRSTRRILHIASELIARNKERKEKVEWHNVVVYGARAEALAKILSKGAGVLVEGGLHTYSYEKDNVTRYMTDIVAREICFAGKRSYAEAGDGSPRFVPKSARNGSPKQESETLPLEDIPF